MSQDLVTVSLSWLQRRKQIIYAKNLQGTIPAKSNYCFENKFGFTTGIHRVIVSVKSDSFAPSVSPYAHHLEIANTENFPQAKLQISKVDYESIE